MIFSIRYLRDPLEEIVVKIVLAMPIEDGGIANAIRIFYDA